jgi:hypothetical protein
MPSERHVLKAFLISAKDMDDRKLWSNCIVIKVLHKVDTVLNAISIEQVVEKIRNAGLEFQHQKCIIVSNSNTLVIRYALNLLTLAQEIIPRCE